jgi:hypothetical protein
VGWNNHRDLDEDELPDLLNYLIDNGELAGAQLVGRQAGHSVRHLSNWRPSATR